jgi:O-antigen ligase
MAKRRQDSKQAKKKNAPAPVPNSQSGFATSVPGARWPILLVLLSFFARWLVPTEGALQGKTLWLVAATFLSTALYCWWQSRQVHTERPRFGILDATVAILALAHVVSALLVLTSSGQKRFALTMLWEWTAVAVQFIVLRQVIADRVNLLTVRNAMLAILIALSGYGIYQHWIEHPAQVEQYMQSQKQIAELPSTNRTPDQDRKHRELTASLLGQNVPLTGRARELFERRLRDSIEPYGFFALANTFGGFVALLVVMLLVQLLPIGSQVEDKFQWSTWLKQRWPLVLAFAVAAYCLMLTKSRSAYLATFAGTAVLGLQWLRLRSAGDRWQKIMLGIVIITAIVVVLVVIGFATGSLDVEVFSESSKSLRYRIQYWTGTSSVIQQHPWFGVGPGNFRGHYLKNKLPEASEEIADPHQYALDVFVNSGVIGLVAVLFLTWLFLKTLIKPSPANEPSSSASLSESNNAQTFAGLTIAGAVVVVFVWQWVIDARTNTSLLATGFVATVIGFLLDQRNSRSRDDQSSTRNESDATFADSQTGTVVFGASSAAVLFTHLLVAGGIAYPAVNLTLFLLVAISTMPRQPLDDSDDVVSQDDSQSNRRIAVWQASSVACIVLGVSSLMIGLAPVLRSETALRFGDYILTVQGDMGQARSEYMAAATADPLAPQPHLSLAQLSFRSSTNGRNEKYFAEAVTHALDAAARDPNSRIALHMVAKWYYTRSLTLSEDNDAKEAVRWYREVLAGYPTQPTWNAEFALALENSGQQSEAKQQAIKTLTLENINRTANHTDRFLADDLLIKIQELAELKMID